MLVCSDSKRVERGRVLKYLKIFLVIVSCVVPVTCVQADPPMEDTIMAEIQCAIDPVCYRDRVTDLRQKANEAQTFYAWMSVYRDANRLGKKHMQRRAVRRMQGIATTTEQRVYADWLSARLDKED